MMAVLVFLIAIAAFFAGGLVMLLILEPWWWKRRLQREIQTLSAARTPMKRRSKRPKAEGAAEPRGPCGVRGCRIERPHSHVIDLAERLKEKR